LKEEKSNYKLTISDKQVINYVEENFVEFVVLLNLETAVGPERRNTFKEFIVGQLTAYEDVHSFAYYGEEEYWNS
jgi:hypothetical protein